MKTFFVFPHPTILLPEYALKGGISLFCDETLYRRHILWGTFFQPPNIFFQPPPFFSTSRLSVSTPHLFFPAPDLSFSTPRPSFPAPLALFLIPSPFCAFLALCSTRVPCSVLCHASTCATAPELLGKQVGGEGGTQRLPPASTWACLFPALRSITLQPSPGS